ncbi:DUF1192 domain-containing protein [Maritimibacter sp. DP1N21-5]|uniref:DUF1192 domain-containing protein n=1 Tax=Maritimibacter sp. DP1N21-5 TaxID=2836867 RepID=UPI001C481744|nr:DUF1192 domain-containing protein [Maritimibacter sp. DP1N21-5]MBV7408711.1 DUF1192 domain-containing protein [Maritimibacter sp. DP1N21-5]
MSDPGQIHHEPEVKEGYATEFYPVRWLAYKPKSDQFRRGIKGRWQRMNEYGGWENLPRGEPIGPIHPNPFDADEAADRITALEAEVARLREAMNAKVQVKPLVWEDERISRNSPRQTADSIIGCYEVLQWSSGDYGGSAPAEDPGDQNEEFSGLASLDEAKAHCQADYEGRIRAALQEDGE